MIRITNTKTIKITAPVTSSNFRADVNANGIVSNTNVRTTRTQVSTTLP